MTSKVPPGSSIDIWQAAANNDVVALNSFISMGTSVNSLDAAGWTPLHHACDNFAVKAVQELLKHDAKTLIRYYCEFR